jgi:hypothetical protein
MKIFPPMKRLLLIALGAPLLVFGWIAASQAGMIYFPQPYAAEELVEMEREGLQRVDFETKQGAQAAFYKAPAAGSPEKIWLVFCGNGARSADYYDLATHEQYGYYFIDYPGYGACSGKPGPKRIDAQVQAAVSALAKELELDDEALRAKLSIFGHSIGAAVALRSALMLDVDEVVIVSPFTSMKAMAELAVGKVLSNALLHRFDNVDALTKLVAAKPDTRVTLFHGKADEIVPFTMGESLAKGFADHVAFHPIEGNGHNDIVGRQIRPITAAMAR